MDRLAGQDAAETSIAPIASITGVSKKAARSTERTVAVATSGSKAQQNGHEDYKQPSRDKPIASGSTSQQQSFYLYGPANDSW